MIDLAPFHVISYGTLLGSQVFQTFVGGIVAFRTLPRPQFATLQTAVFPIYFGLQTALPVIVAITYPGLKSIQGQGPSSLYGLLEKENRFTTLVPIVTMFATGLANMLVVGPATTKIKDERNRQEIRDGKKSYDPAPHSKEMVRLNKSFGRMHGISSLVNLTGLLATVFYGTVLAGRLQ
ncbi:hypothetical protein FQN54_003568 [Arachnomyces sp. PD_36]|nr:hypothetical protein FQN54_003568 [Arachnomyces sp. PD_36]